MIHIPHLMMITMIPLMAYQLDWVQASSSPSSFHASSSFAVSGLEEDEDLGRDYSVIPKMYCLLYSQMFSEAQCRSHSALTSVTPPNKRPTLISIVSSTTGIATFSTITSLGSDWSSRYSFRLLLDSKVNSLTDGPFYRRRLRMHQNCQPCVTYVNAPPPPPSGE